MNKKLNTALFIVLATVVNIVLMVAIFLILLVIFSRFVKEESSFTVLYMMFIFLCSIGGTFFIYTFLIKWATKKFNLEEKLHPIFKGRSRRDMRE